MPRFMRGVGGGSAQAVPFRPANSAAAENIDFSAISYAIVFVPLDADCDIILDPTDFQDADRVDYLFLQTGAGGFDVTLDDGTGPDSIPVAQTAGAITKIEGVWDDSLNEYLYDAPGAGAASIPPIWRFLHMAGGRATTSPAAPSGVRYVLASPSSDVVNITTAMTIPPLAYQWTAAEQDVSGLATKLRVRARVAAFSTDPGQTITFGLYPVTFASSSQWSLASPVVPSSTVALAPAGNGRFVKGASAEFDPPADGDYALGYEFPAQLAAIALLSARLEVRNV